MKATKKTSEKHGDEVSSSRAEQPPRLVVRFAESDTFHNVLGMGDYTPNEIDASWFSGDEYGRMLRKNHKVIRNMETNGGITIYCSRGLERMTRPRMEIRQQKRMNVHDAVLDLQLSQWEQGRDDQDQIAELCQRLSIECQTEAIRIGKKDEFAVFKENAKSASLRHLCKTEHPPQCSI
jgi:hypothetical protein